MTYCNHCRTGLLLLFVLVTYPGLACAQQEEAPTATYIESTLSGHITVRPEIDSTADYRGFEVLVAVDNEGEPDTLGFAVTDSSGFFAMDVEAEQRGVYALIISRRGEILEIGHLAVSHGDSAQLKAMLPVGSASLRPRSAENAAWQAYQNTRLQHDDRLITLAQAIPYDESAVRLQVSQTAMIMWDLQEIYGGTMGAEVAAAEAVVMMAGWSDSLVVAWGASVSPDNVQFGEVGRVVRQAVDRLEGPQAALDTLDNYAQRATQEDHQMELMSERVMAHLDYAEHDEALAAAERLVSEFPESAWAEWATRAAYEIRNLLPGMIAPTLIALDTAGVEVNLQDLTGRYVVLEFYRPEDDIFQREVEGRNQLIEDYGRENIEFVSISLQPDTLVNQAFFEERELPGIHIYGTSNLARLYNVNVLPTRYLIDPEGRLVEKYVGGAMAALYEFMILMREENEN